ncbi:MAG TPA: OPT/YSL family transporter, partial [Paludibacter sp.]|nr:OPT/YSL family transporter [Paludibacter sp.]
KFLGTLVSAATVGGVIIVLNKTYGFTGEGALVAPQANAMAAVIEPLMSGTGAPWFLYAFGAGIALLLTFLKIPALAFALGMFIPLELNLPLLVGGGISWFVSTRSKNQALNTARKDKGTLLASGFIAGGALMGVVSALIKFIQTTMVEKKIAALGDAANPAIINNIKESHSFFLTTWESSAGAQWLAIVMYAALIVYFAWDAMRAKT